MKNVILLGIYLGVSLLQADESSAKKLYKANCIMCHTTKLITRDQKKGLIGPPIDEVMLHVKERYPDRDKAVNFIADYLMHPSADKALCASIDKFGVMPSMKSRISNDEAVAVSEMIFDKFPRQQFATMERKSREGITFETIDSNGDGKITSKEFQHFRAKRNHMNPDSFKHDLYFQKIDQNGDGFMDKVEFQKMREERMK